MPLVSCQLLERVPVSVPSYRGEVDLSTDAAWPPAAGLRLAGGVLRMYREALETILGGVHAVGVGRLHVARSEARIRARSDRGARPSGRVDGVHGGPHGP